GKGTVHRLKRLAEGLRGLALRLARRTGLTLRQLLPRLAELLPGLIELALDALGCLRLRLTQGGLCDLCRRLRLRHRFGCVEQILLSLGKLSRRRRCTGLA